MSKFVIPENGHVVNIIPPIDINGSGADSDVFSMKDASHVDIILTLGVTGAATTFTVEECDDFTPTNSTAIAFSYYAETTAAGDTLGARTAATTAGIAASTNDNITYVISIDAEELSEGYNNLRISLTDPSAATVVSAVAVLSGLSYQEGTTRTQIA